MKNVFDTTYETPYSSEGDRFVVKKKCDGCGLRTKRH